MKSSEIRPYELAIVKHVVNGVDKQALLAFTDYVNMSYKLCNLKTVWTPKQVYEDPEILHELYESDKLFLDAYQKIKQKPLEYFDLEVSPLLKGADLL